MSNTRSGGGPDDGDGGSWASEALPMSVRRELLDRDLKKLGTRKAEAGQGSASGNPLTGQQEGQSPHPGAGGGSDAQHGD